ncbi:MAG: hypothetical protein A4E20_08910 [Nitrospira sp. SG-bin2]|nr:MAG: hypothetical protein A4E20_08910 [Nitrospira sp. SG-bin2]
MQVRPRWCGSAAVAAGFAYVGDGYSDNIASVADCAIRAMRSSGADGATLAKAEESLTGIVRQHFPQPPEVKL